MNLIIKVKAIQKSLMTALTTLLYSGKTPLIKQRLNQASHLEYLPDSPFVPSVIGYLRYLF